MSSFDSLMSPSATFGSKPTGTYSVRAAHLARRWENEVTAALVRIEKNPRSGAKCGFSANELQGIRRMPIAGFPRHLIFYRAEEEEIRILRVVHGARDLESLL